MTTTLKLGTTYVTGRYERQEISIKTRDSHLSALRHLSSYIGTVRVSEITRDDVELWVQSQMALSPATVTLRISFACGFFNWLQERGKIKTNPVLRTKRPKIPRRVPRGLSQGTVRQLLRAVDNSRDKTIILLMLQEGLRCEEVSLLQVADLDFGQGTMLVNGKGAKQRVLPISDESFISLKLYMEPPVP